MGLLTSMVFCMGTEDTTTVYDQINDSCINAKSKLITLNIESEGMRVDIHQDGCIVFTYSNGKIQTGYVIAYPKEGPFYSSGEKPINFLLNGNTTCENPHYNQKEFFSNAMGNISFNNFTVMHVTQKHVPEVSNAVNDAINLANKLKHLEFIHQAIEIRRIWYEEISDKIAANKGTVNVRAVVYESIKNPILQKFWLVEKDTDSFLNNEVVATIMGLNIEDIHNVDVPADAKIVLSHINVQISLCNLAESRDIPYIHFISNTKMYKTLLEENHHI